MTTPCANSQEAISTSCYPAWRARTKSAGSRGSPAKAVRALADDTVSQRGVRHGQLHLVPAANQVTLNGGGLSLVSGAGHDAVGALGDRHKLLFEPGRALRVLGPNATPSERSTARRRITKRR